MARYSDCANALLLRQSGRVEQERRGRRRVPAIPEVQSGAGDRSGAGLRAIPARRGTSFSDWRRVLLFPLSHTDLRILFVRFRRLKQSALAPYHYLLRIKRYVTMVSLGWILLYPPYGTWWQILPYYADKPEAQRTHKESGTVAMTPLQAPRDRNSSTTAGAYSPYHPNQRPFR